MDNSKKIIMAIEQKRPIKLSSFTGKEFRKVIEEISDYLNRKKNSENEKETI